jgi:hypothetical protein
MAVKTPPQKMPIHMAGLRIFALSGHCPDASREPDVQPAKATGVEVLPTMSPMPSEYVKPIRVRKSPMPTLVASLMQRGMTRASHWEG